MACIGTIRVATCAAAAALAGASAAAFPSVGRADDGAPPSATVPVPTTAAESVALAAAVEEEAEALSEEIATVVDDGTQAAEVPVEPQGSPEPAEDGAAPAPDASAQPEASSAESTQSPDTTGNSGDTTADTSAAATVTPVEPSTSSQPAVTAQTSPANVNVSVRIDSPGDDGPVTQVNLAAAIVTEPSAAPTERTASRPATGAAPEAGGGGQATPPSAAVADAISPSAQADDGWTWNWDCVSVPAFTPISNGGSSGGSMPRSWTWNWNCPDNHEQYRGATTGQYQPVNVNVSIRVASPGDNGAVSQSNVAIAIGATREGSAGEPPRNAPAPAPSGPGSGGGAPAGLPSLPGLSALPSLPALPAFADATPAVEAGDLAPLVVGAAIADAGEPLELPHVLPGLGRPAWVVPAIDGGRSGDDRPALPGGGWLRPIVAPTLGSPLDGPRIGAPRLDGRGSGAREARPPSAQKRVERAPRWRTPAPTSPAPESAPSGTSASAAAGGGASGGGLPVFLALPFLAALLDLARRVAHERVALPSGHRGRARDDPG